MVQLISSKLELLRCLKLAGAKTSWAGAGLSSRAVLITPKCRTRHLSAYGTETFFGTLFLFPFSFFL